MARPDHPLLREGHFKIGVFSSNCSGGKAATTVPERWDASWDKNLALAQMADEVGIDFLLPIARFGGYGGETNFQGESLETLVWATGLLAATRRLTCFATVHTAFCHPVLAAKQFATADQVGHGRFGLNIVAGWNKPEYDMFGLDLPSEHADRYALADEWCTIVRRIWESEEPFDWEGRYFRLKGAVRSTRPWAGSPVILNAASSGEGRAFATRHADVMFTAMTDVDSGRAKVEAIRAEGRAAGRSLGLFTSSYVVCRPTAREAEEYHRYYAEEHADTEAAERLMALQGLHARSFPPEAFREHRIRFAAGHGSYPLVGDPDRVAAEIGRIAGAGFDGVTVSFVDYLAELPFFADEVLPRLQRQNLRRAA